MKGTEILFTSNFSTKFQEFSRRRFRELNSFPGVFQSTGRNFQNSRSFPENWKKFSKFQVFSRDRKNVV